MLIDVSKLPFKLLYQFVDSNNIREYTFLYKVQDMNILFFMILLPNTRLSI